MSTSPASNVLFELNRTVKAGERVYTRVDKYDQWVRTIQPLDLIAFGPLSCLTCQEGVSQMIRVFQTLYQCKPAKWSHVGIALPGYMLNFENCVPDEMYILESVVSRKFRFKCIQRLTGMDGVVDVTTNDGSNGVQIRLLRDVVKNTTGCVSVIHLKPEYLSDIADTQVRLQQWWDQFKHVPFDTLHCFQTMWRVQCSTCCIPRDSSMFCSEMAAHVYKHLGWIIYNVVPEMINPQSLVDFTGVLIHVYDIFQKEAHVYYPTIENQRRRFVLPWRR